MRKIVSYTNLLRPTPRLTGALGVLLNLMCTPGMGVNLSALSSRPKGLWGESPLYLNPVNGLITLAKVLAEGKGIVVRRCLKEARAQTYEPTNRNLI